MRVYVSSPLMADDTAYGYEARYLDFARKLMQAKITPQELKEHYRDFEWVASILHKEYQRILESSVESLQVEIDVPEPKCTEFIEVKVGGENA